MRQTDGNDSSRTVCHGSVISNGREDDHATDEEDDDELEEGELRSRPAA